VPQDVTETLEVIPRQWKVIQTVREKFSCRQCEAIGQPPAPFHVTPRGFAGPHLLAMGARTELACRRARLSRCAGRMRSARERARPFSRQPGGPD
jgi:transposase